MRGRARRVRRRRLLLAQRPAHARRLQMRRATVPGRAAAVRRAAALRGRLRRGARRLRVPAPRPRPRGRHRAVVERVRSVRRHRGVAGRLPGGVGGAEAVEAARPPAAARRPAAQAAAAAPPAARRQRQRHRVIGQPVPVPAADGEPAAVAGHGVGRQRAGAPPRVPPLPRHEPPAAAHARLHRRRRVRARARRPRAPALARPRYVQSPTLIMLHAKCKHICRATILQFNII